MLSAAYILYALAQTALAVWAYRVYSATPNAGTVTLMLPIAARRDSRAATPDRDA